MKFQPLSFGVGIIAGFAVLLVFAGGMRLFAPNTPTTPFRQGTGQGMMLNSARMAERLGMTEEQLQKELVSGKTMQQLMQEKGVAFPGRGGAGGSGSLAPRGGSGSTSSLTASGAVTR